MRIVLIGQAAFGAKTLEALKEQNESVVAVYTPPGKPGGKADPLKEAAMSKNIPVYEPIGFKSNEVFQQYRDLRPDLTILAFVTAIVPSRYFEAATMGAICYHPSLLPRHRGASAINWAVIMGDDKTGLTIFWPDDGIDTGPILLQKEVPIGPEDTTGSLYFNHLFPMGIEAIRESVALIKQGKAPRRVQDEMNATYEPPCDDRVASIDWRKPARDIYNLIRGCDPQPGAYAIFKGEKIRFYGPRFHAGPDQAPPGTIIGLDAAGIHLAVSGGEIIVEKLKASSGGKVPGREWAEEKGLKVGYRFGG